MPLGEKGLRTLSNLDNHMVYLDYAASTPLREIAKAALSAFYDEPYSVANPSSLHTLGREASQALEAARKSISQATQNAFKPSEVTFTGGGTEAINLTIFGILEGLRNQNPARTKVFISAFEHDAVFDLISPLKRAGFDVITIPVTKYGLVDVAFLEKNVDEKTALVCVMGANNETGIVQEIATIADIAHAKGAYLFCDCVQAFLKTDLPYEAIDALAFAGHKIGGPKGVGAMLIKRDVPYAPQVFGGGQEGKRRPGTQNLPGAVALGKTVGYVFENNAAIEREIERKVALVEDFLFADGTGILPSVSQVAAAKENVKRVPGIVSAYVPGFDSGTLILALDARGFAVSAASACTAGVAGGSRVLRAMGFSADDAASSLRISFDERVSDEDLTAFCEALLDIMKTLPKN